jgi:gas vesicle protein
MEHKNNEVAPRSSHWVAALLAGLATGVAAGLFINSKKGKELSKEAKKMAVQLQKQLGKKLENIKDLTQEKYAELVDDIVDRYTSTKELAEDELTKLKEYLLEAWDGIQEQLQADKEEEEK